MTKSCFNCKHLKTWNYSGTLEDPPDSGWECGHKSQEIKDSIPDTEELRPDPECPSCKGHGWTNDYGFPSIGEVGSEDDECGCWDETDDEIIGEFQAKNCQGYEFFDWDEQERTQAICEDSLPNDSEKLFLESVGY